MFSKSSHFFLAAFLESVVVSGASLTPPDPVVLESHEADGEGDQAQDYSSDEAPGVESPLAVIRSDWSRGDGRG